MQSLLLYIILRSKFIPYLIKIYVESFIIKDNLFKSYLTGACQPASGRQGENSRVFRK